MPESPCVREGGRKTENSHLHTWRGVGRTEGARAALSACAALYGTDGMATTNDQEEDGEEEEDG